MMQAGRGSLGCSACGGSAAAALLLGLGVLYFTTLAIAQPADKLPPELEGIGITERLNSQLPVDAVFLNESGRAVKLGDFFDGKRPVILTLNYYGCPMLCGLQLNGLLEGLRDLKWTAGDEFEIVTVSFDPLETPQLARLKKENYVNEYGRNAAERGWHFLTGSKDSIRKLTEAVGFTYRWNEDRREWMHAAGIIVCTPAGRVSRYQYGVMYEAPTLRMSLVEAADGKIGTTLDQILFYCYHWDSSRGKYSADAMAIMRVGGGLSAVALGAMVLTLWRRDRRRRGLPAAVSAG